MVWVCVPRVTLPCRSRNHEAISLALGLHLRELLRLPPVLPPSFSMDEITWLFWGALDRDHNPQSVPRELQESLKAVKTFLFFVFSFWFGFFVFLFLL